MSVVILLQLLKRVKKTVNLLDQGGVPSINVEVLIDDNNIDQLHDAIKLVLLDYQATQGTDTEAYVVSATESEASVNILDNDVPVISLSGVTEITENNTANFTLTSTIERATGVDLSINYALTDQTGSYLGSNAVTSGTITLAAGGINEVAQIPVTIADDLIDEAFGMIRVAILDDTPSDSLPPSYTIAPTSHMLEVKVKDDDVPVISIAGGAAVTEGGTAMFTISSNIEREVGRDLEIQYSTLVYSNSFSAHVVSHVTLESGNTGVTATVPLPTIGDSIDEANGVVSIEIRPATIGSPSEDPLIYTISQTDDTADVSVIDDDVPTISITAGADITEGGIAEFTFSASIVRKDVPITINFLVAGNNFFDSSNQSESDSIVLPTGGIDVMTAKSIQTIDDNEIESGGNGKITISLDNSGVSGPGNYQYTSGASASVSVFDNDTKPTISISGGGAVTEGTDAIFTVVSNQSLGQDLGFGYSFTEGSHNFIASTHTIRTGTVYIREGNSDGQTEILPGVIDIPTEDDRVDEANGTITVNLYTLAPTITEYQLDPNNSSATVIVNDNDVPAISVTTDGFSVAEGRDAVFTFSADIERSSGRDITINFGVVGTENYLHSSQPATDSIELPAGGTGVTVTKNIRTNDLRGSGRDGRITVTITSPTVSDDIDPITYTISENNGDAFVPVRNNDRQGGLTEGYNDEFLFLEEIASAERSYAEGSFNAPIQEQNETRLPRVSISSPNERVKEGEVIYFEVSLDSPVSEPIIVRIKVSEESGRFLRYTEKEGPVIIGARSSRTVIKVETIDDIVFDGEGTVTAEIQEDNEIYVIESGNAEVTVFDIESEELSNRYSNVNDNVLPDLIQSMSANLVDSISNRVARASTVAGLEQVQFEVGGYNSLQDILEFKANEINDSANSWTSLLENSSFQLPLLSAAGDTIPVTVWGIGDHAQINESDPNSTVSQDGELYTAQLGFDARYENGLLTGVAISRFESDLEYTNQVGNDSATEGTHQVQLKQCSTISCMGRRRARF